MFTSANPSEGKTTTTANIAVVLLNKEKVLLIDADMRKPAMHQMFQVDNIFGLTNVLTHSERLEKCVQTTLVDNLHFLACAFNSAKSGRIVRFEINERASWTSIQHVRLSYF